MMEMQVFIFYRLSQTPAAIQNSNLYLTLHTALHQIMYKFFSRKLLPSTIFYIKWKNCERPYAFVLSFMQLLIVGTVKAMINDVFFNLIFLLLNEQVVYNLAILLIYKNSINSYICDFDMREWLLKRGVS